MINEIKAAWIDVSLPTGNELVTRVSTSVLRSESKFISVSVKLSLCVLVGTLYSTSSFASLTAVVPFAGTYSETFDGFPSQDNQVFVPDSVPTFDGHAIMTGSLSSTLAVYELWQTFVPIDGRQFVVSQQNDLITTFAFDRPLTDFGGYFATGVFVTGDYNQNGLKVTYIDANGNVVGTDTRTPTSLIALPLTWLGWHSDTAFTTVEISVPGGFYMMDSLQVQAVPEPSTVIAGALLLVPFAFSKFQGIRKK